MKMRIGYRLMCPIPSYTCWPTTTEIRQKSLGDLCERSRLAAGFKASRADGPLVVRIESVFMRPPIIPQSLSLVARIQHDYEGEVINVDQLPFKIVLIAITRASAPQILIVRSVFHQASVSPDTCRMDYEMTVEDFAGFVQSQQPSPAESGAKSMLEILSIEIAGYTGPCVFASPIWDDLLDTFGMLQVDGQWVIYNKLFHVEG